ncbi:hypothetical protein OH77DRAFT_121833 [Trametes cingulata]|nr:hypothetical protein OH77DRAFT_121833 [Trametes cingulata]
MGGCSSLRQQIDYRPTTPTVPPRCIRRPARTTAHAAARSYQARSVLASPAASLSTRLPPALTPYAPLSDTLQLPSLHIRHQDVRSSPPTTAQPARSPTDAPVLSRSPFFCARSNPARSAVFCAPSAVLACLRAPPPPSPASVPRPRRHRRSI